MIEVHSFVGVESYIYVKADNISGIWFEVREGDELYVKRKKQQHQSSYDEIDTYSEGERFSSI